jgi:hypothetical protein
VDSDAVSDTVGAMELNEVRQQLVMRTLQDARMTVGGNTERALVDVFDGALAAVSITTMAGLVPALLQTLVKEYELATTRCELGMARAYMTQTHGVLEHAMAAYMVDDPHFDADGARAVCELAAWMQNFGMSECTPEEAALAALMGFDLADADLLNAAHGALRDAEVRRGA